MWSIECSSPPGQIRVSERDGLKVRRSMRKAWILVILPIGIEWPCSVSTGRIEQPNSR